MEGFDEILESLKSQLNAIPGAVVVERGTDGPPAAA